MGILAGFRDEQRTANGTRRESGPQSGAGNVGMHIVPAEFKLVRNPAGRHRADRAFRRTSI